MWKWFSYFKQVQFCSFCHLFYNSSDSANNFRNISYLSKSSIFLYNAYTLYDRGSLSLFFRLFVLNDSRSITFETVSWNLQSETITVSAVTEKSSGIVLNDAHLYTFLQSRYIHNLFEIFHKSFDHLKLNILYNFKFCNFNGFCGSLKHGLYSIVCL